MQLRRSLSATAVAAMVSSVAIFAAPAAMAATGASTTPSTSASSTAAPKGDAEKPTTGNKSTASTSAAPAADKGNENVPPAIVGNGAVSKGISAKVDNFPGKLVVGDKAKPFTTTITNQGKKSLALAPGFEFWNDEGTLKASQVVLEYLDGNTWKRARLADQGHGVLGGFLAMDGEFVETPYQVAAGKSVTVQLRIAVTKDAPLGKGFGFNATVGFLDEDEHASASAMSDTFGFLIAKADSAGGTPTTPTTKPQPQPQPKPKPGTVKSGKDLAETGGDNNTPVLIGAAAGTALVVGAGFVLISRRRRNGTAA